MSNSIVAGLKGVWQSEEFQDYVFMPMVCLIALGAMAGLILWISWLCICVFPPWLGWIVGIVSVLAFIMGPHMGTFIKHYKEATNGS